MAAGGPIPWITGYGARVAESLRSRKGIKSSKPQAWELWVTDLGPTGEMNYG